MQCPPPSPELGASPHSPVPESHAQRCSSPAQMSSTSSFKRNAAQKQEEHICRDMSTCGERDPLISYEDWSKPIGNVDSGHTKKRKLTAPKSNRERKTPRRLNLGRNPVQAVEAISHFAGTRFSPESAKSICSTITQKLWQSSLTSSPAFVDIRSNRQPCAQCHNLFRARAGNTICFVCYLENQIEEKSTGVGSEQEMSESPTLLSTIAQLRRSLSLMESIQTSITPMEVNELSFWIGHVNVSTNSLTDCLNRLRMGTSSPLSTKQPHSDSNHPMSSSSPMSRPKNPLCQEIDGISVKSESDELA